VAVSVIAHCSSGCIPRLDDLHSRDAGAKVVFVSRTDNPPPAVPDRISESQPVSSHGEDGGAADADACATGTYLRTETSSCARHSICPPGAFVAGPGTTTQDVVCAACPSGTFSSEDNALSCEKWTECSPGEYVEAVGTDRVDRQCATCPNGTTTFGVNVGGCSTGEQCPAGTTSSSSQTCEECDAGGYCAGGDAPFVACGPSTWDDDRNAATPCVNKSRCLAGERIAYEGNHVEDRSCAACEPGTFSDVEDAGSCRVWTTCEGGFHVLAGGTAVTDRTCEPCEPGKFANEVNSDSCQSWRDCEAPDEYVSREPSATRDRVCSPCAPGDGAIADNAESCVTEAFQSQGGLASLEAENYHLATGADGDDWYELELGAVSGGKFIEVGPDDHSDWTDDPFANAPRLDYLVHFDRVGEYYVHVRGDAGANSEGFSDSCYIALDGVTADWYNFRVVGNVWEWQTRSVGLVGVGLHTVSLLAREDGFRADKIVVSLNQTQPTGAGPPESALGP
jgi:hypothetical protein